MFDSMSWVWKKDLSTLFNDNSDIKKPSTIETPKPSYVKSSVAGFTLDYSASGLIATSETLYDFNDDYGYKVNPTKSWIWANDIDESISFSSDKDKKFISSMAISDETKSISFSTTNQNENSISSMVVWDATISPVLTTDSTNNQQVQTEIDNELFQPLDSEHLLSNDEFPENVPSFFEEQIENYYDDSTDFLFQYEQSDNKFLYSLEKEL